jgi:hypothetical protein
MEENKEQILKIVYRAKEIYIENQEFVRCCSLINHIRERHLQGMCSCFIQAIMEINNEDKTNYREFNPRCYIPLFNREFFGISDSVCYEDQRGGRAYWWDVYDVKSRINAFDKLIGEYDLRT